MNTLNKLKKGNWVVLYYSDTCGYCNEFMPIWELFLKKKHKNVKKIRINVNNSRDVNPVIDGVPTIHFYKNGKITPKGVFNDSRTLDNLNSFYLKNIGAKKTKKIKKTKKRKTSRK